MKQNLLPVELQQIQPPSSPQDCVNKVLELVEPKNDREKYSLHLSRQYFRDNFFLFSKNDFLQMSKNLRFIRRFEYKYANEIMMESIKNQTPLPFLHNGWLNLNISEELKVKYLELLNSHNEEEQLKVFYNHDKYLVSQSFFSKVKQPCDALTDIVLEENPHRILTLQFWNPEQICNWLEVNKNKIKTIIEASNFAVSYNNIHPKVRMQVYKNILDNHQKNTQNLEVEKLNLCNTFVQFPHEFLVFAKENYQSLFNNLLKSRITHPDNEHLTLNALQYILMTRIFTKIEDIAELFEPHKDIILTESTLKLDIYTSHVHPFELAITQRTLPLFALFSLHDDLEESEKDMLVAAAFISMRNKYTELPKYPSDKRVVQGKKNAVMFDWHRDIIEECTLEQFNEYSNEVTKTINNKDLAIELDALKLSKELNKHLPKNLKVGKKIKI